MRTQGRSGGALSLPQQHCTPHMSPQDPNQLIRASALRVLSSIRVPIIVPIMMLAIKEAASDMSPYVRKTAAHAIPKLYR